MTTGFGSLCKISIDKDSLSQLQKNLVMSHACVVRFTVEPPLPPQTLTALGAKQVDSRGMMETTHDATAVYAALKQSGAKIRYFQQGHGSLETFYLDFLRKDDPATDKQNPQ